MMRQSENRWGNSGSFTDLAIGTDGSMIVSGDDDGSIVL